jgi:hypothetical protein
MLVQISKNICQNPRQELADYFLDSLLLQPDRDLLMCRLHLSIEFQYCGCYDQSVVVPAIGEKVRLDSLKAP